MRSLAIVSAVVLASTTPGPGAESPLETAFKLPGIAGNPFDPVANDVKVEFRHPDGEEATRGDPFIVFPGSNPACIAGDIVICCPRTGPFIIRLAPCCICCRSMRFAGVDCGIWAICCCMFVTYAVMD